VPLKTFYGELGLPLLVLVIRSDAFALRAGVVFDKSFYSIALSAVAKVETGLLYDDLPTPLVNWLKRFLDCSSII
jgi:hypothetical protein